MNITSDLTRGLWRMMHERFGTYVVPKSEAREMRLAGHVLDLVGIMDRDTFMHRYTTVWGRRIYPWFTIGEGNENDLWYQMVICVHEHQHVVQFRRDGLLGYGAMYLLSTRQRAMLEAEAYRCNLEMNWWRTGAVSDPLQLAGRLAQYGCKPADIEAAHQYLNRAAHEIRRGKVANAASVVAIEWLEEHT